MRMPKLTDGFLRKFSIFKCSTKRWLSASLIGFSKKRATFEIVDEKSWKVTLKYEISDANIWRMSWLLESCPRKTETERLDRLVVAILLQRVVTVATNLLAPRTEMMIRDNNVFGIARNINDFGPNF